MKYLSCAIDTMETDKDWNVCGTVFYNNTRSKPILNLLDSEWSDKKCIDFTRVGKNNVSIKVLSIPISKPIIRFIP